MSTNTVSVRIEPHRCILANKGIVTSLISFRRIGLLLSNERFLSKAPESKVAEEKAKLEKYTNMMEQVKERLAQLGR